MKKADWFLLFFLFLIYLFFARIVIPRGDAAYFYANGLNLWSLIDGNSASFNRTPPLVTLWQFILIIPERFGLVHDTRTLILFSAILGIGMIGFFMAICRQYFSEQQVKIMALTLGLASPLWSYVMDIYSECLQAFLLTAFLFYWIKTKPITGKNNYLAAIFLGLLTLSKAYYVLILPFWILIDLSISWKSSKKHHLIFSWVLCCVIFSFYLGYNYYLNGSAINFGYQNLGTRDQIYGFNMSIITSFYTFLLTIDKNIFLHCLPILFLLLLRRSMLPDSLVVFKILVCILLPLIVVSKWWAYHGDWQWGPRLLVPLYPSMLLLAGFGMRSWLESTKAWPRYVLMLLVLLSAWVNLPAMLISPLSMSEQVWRATEDNLPLYNQQFQIRDDQLLKRYVPEFNEISGQTWLAMRYVIPNLPPPWAALGNTKWTNSNVPAPLEWYLGKQLYKLGIEEKFIVLFYYFMFSILLIWMLLFRNRDIARGLLENSGEHVK